MHHTLCVRERHRVEHGADDLAGLLLRQQPIEPAQVVVEARTVHILHHDRRDAALVDGVGHPDNVGVNQVGLDDPLLEEAASRVGIARELRDEGLDGNQVAEAGVLRLIDHARAALSEHLPDAVGPLEDLTRVELVDVFLGVNHACVDPEGATARGGTCCPPRAPCSGYPASSKVESGVSL